MSNEVATGTRAEIAITPTPIVTEEECVEMIKHLTFDGAARVVRRLQRSHSFEADYLSQTLTRCLKTQTNLLDLLKAEQESSVSLHACSIIKCAKIYRQCLIDDERKDREGSQMAMGLLGAIGGAFFGNLQRAQQNTAS